MRPFPIPVVTLGPGSQPVESGPECIDMPTDMQVFSRPPAEFETDPQLAAAASALLQALLERMQEQGFGRAPVRLDLRGLPAAQVRAVSDALGEGEVSIVLHTDEGETRIQETAFAGIWRLLRQDDDGTLREDAIEACAIPPRVIAAARAVAQPALAATPPPQGVMNSPALLNELVAASAQCRDGGAAHVLNLTLLPLTQIDVQHLVDTLGPGSTRLLSRGYGKCRIVSTQLRDTWWVQYFNGMDKLILNTVEVVDIPEVALAAAEDWGDSLERLRDLIDVLVEV